uniref:Uncharacterized protein n=1 Tax=Anguilla anguilla TaxID=7936 RepID=A0A0E9R951_ANGAN
MTENPFSLMDICLTFILNNGLQLKTS